MRVTLVKINKNGDVEKIDIANVDNSYYDINVHEHTKQTEGIKGGWICYISESIWVHPL